MSHQRVLETTDSDVSVDTAVIAKTVSSLNEAAAAATGCANACLATQDPETMARCITIDLDTADIAAATARVLSRLVEFPEEIARAQAETACRALETCAEECASHDHDHCQACASACREADEQLHQFLDALS